MTDISAREITQLIKAQLAGLDRGIDTAEVGTVSSVGDGIARVYGLEKVMAGELLEFPNEVFGLALNLEEEDVGCVLMGDTSKIRRGTRSAGRSGSSRSPSARPSSAASSTRSASRSTARARSRRRSSTRSSGSRPASSTASPSRSRCRRASRRSTR